jgi:hypothetical protein
MSDNASLEARIGRLLDAYADGAAIDVDAMTMARLAAARGRRARGPHVLFVPSRTSLVFLLLLMATLTIVGGALVAGAPSPEPEPVVPVVRGEPVEPFLGLPPIGAAISTPERGDLELSLGGRLKATSGHDRMWVFADGRLIRVLEKPYPQPVTEQRLSPEGVQLLRAALLRTAAPAQPNPEGSTTFNEAGVYWGGASIRIDDRVVPVTWSDAELPERLIDPESWLPARAWQDARAIGYVAGRYAACLGSDAKSPALDHLPQIVTDLILAHGTPIADPRTAGPLLQCFEVPTDRAREIEQALIDAGMRREQTLSATFFLGRARDVILQFLPITPDGAVMCDCG